jgi:hypothetical protein
MYIVIVVSIVLIILYNISCNPLAISISSSCVNLNGLMNDKIIIIPLKIYFQIVSMGSTCAVNNTDT